MIALIFSLVCLLVVVDSFSSRVPGMRANWNPALGLSMRGSSEEEYVNPVTAFLGRFLPGSSTSQGVVDTIDWTSKKKRPKSSLAKLASDLKATLSVREWFVTGNVETKFFDEDFSFQDPDVKVRGIEQYARGVAKLFDQQCTRGQIIDCVVNSEVPDTITVTWRLEGRVNLGGAGVPIKAFYVYSDLRVNPANGLIVFQLDRFSIPGWDILTSALFPWLRLPGLSLPAPPV